jgi:hypothetical protein
MSEDTQTQTIALYRNIKYDYTTVSSVTSHYESDPTCVRITDPIIVNFNPRPQAVVQEEMIHATLDKITKAEERHSELMSELDEELQSLRALTAPTAPIEVDLGEAAYVA